MFLASASADATVQICNIMRSLIKGYTCIQVCVYKIEPEPDGVVFYEHFPNREFKKTITNSVMLPLESIVEHVRWHPQAGASTWLASGGRAGLVRVESTVVAKPVEPKTQRTKTQPPKKRGRKKKVVLQVASDDDDEELE